MTYWIIALIVTFLIILIYWVRNNDNSKRKRIEAFLDQSAGVFDNSAQAALAELNDIQDLSADDYFTRAAIRRFYRDVPPTRAENRLIAADYTNAINRIYNHNDPPNEHLIHQAEEFADLYDDAQEADLARYITTHAPAISAVSIAGRAHKAQAASVSKLDALAVAIDDAITYTDDRQNVHDSSVNADLNETIARIKVPVNNQVIDDIRRFLTGPNLDLTQERLTSAKQTLEKMAQGGYISTFKDTESNILAYVWLRCDHPRNAENAAAMREAVITALADSVENGVLVCANGRTARVVGSLVTLDYDTTVGNIMTFEAYKNQIYQETKDLIETCVENASHSQDPTLVAAAIAYTDGDDHIDMHKLNEILKKSICANLSAYSQKIKERDLEQIRSECYIYAGID